jgi:hypothetical protein
MQMRQRLVLELEVDDSDQLQESEMIHEDELQIKFQESEE